MEISPIASPVAPGGYLRSPAVRVTVQNGEWGIHGISWQEPQCGCAEEFPICLAHVKSDPRKPRKGASLPKGIEASYECSPPFDPEELAAAAIKTVENSTEFHVAELIAAQVLAATPLVGTFPLISGLGALVSTVYSAGRGIIHANPFTVFHLLSQQVLSIDSADNFYTPIGGHYVIPNPHLPLTTLYWTGYGAAVLSTVERFGAFDHNTNRAIQGAERHVAAALNMCGATSVEVTIPAGGC